MIYKLQNGGTIKLQKAGSLPRGMQKLNSGSIPNSDESAGERILNSTIEQANKASTQEERDQIYKDSAKKNLAITGQSLMMLPMLGEFTTYGLLGGGLRLGTGIAGSKAGEYVLGKGGDGADKQLNTKFLGTTGRIIGGLGGGGGGSSATTQLFRNLAGKGITLHIPQETFANLRNQYFTNAVNKAMAKATPDIVQMNIEAGKIGWAPSSKQILGHNSDQPLTKLEINFPAWDITQRGAPLGHSWFTGTETAQGFIGKRPYHLRGTVELNKPMIQIGESIGDGKNATRNQILDFSQKSSADGINFKGIADNTLKNQDVYAIFKNTEVKPKLSEAESLGIPKGERSNPKALEDPYYGGYQQGNDRYNTAVESGNGDEIQRLRDLHFKNKTPNNKIVDYMGNPHKVYHGSPEDGYIFDDSKRGVDDVIYFSTDKAYADQYTIPRNQGQKGMIPTRNSREFYLYGKEPINVGSDMYYGSVQDELIHNGANGLNADSVYGLDAITNPLNPSSGIEFGVLRRNQFKLTNPITKTKTGEIIPIVKRDNFHIPDIRYKQGGIIK